MYLKSINPISLKSWSVSFCGQDTIEYKQKESKLKILAARLLAIHNLLDEKGFEQSSKSEKADLLCQAEDLMLQIKYLELSMNSKNQKSAEPKSDNIFQRLLNEKPDFDKRISELERASEILADKIYKALKYEPLGRDLLLPPSGIVKPKAPKPFEKGDKNLTLDAYQQAAVDKFREGNSVVVTAPTGTGKTLIAEHIIDDILRSGKKVIYTTPLKALCNDKYKQFSALWGDYDAAGNLIGKSNVGLATGDVKINTNAPIVVMTTEIYRNLLLQHGEKDVEKELKDVEAVIFDEFHYMGDNQRGSVWEESAMFSPKRMKYLMLSATISNSKKLTDWLNNLTDEHSTVQVNVPEAERHVPLKHFVYSKIDGAIGLFDLIDEKIDVNELENKTLSTREQEVLADLGKMFNYPDGMDFLRNGLSFLYESGTHKIPSARFINELVKNGLSYQKAEQYALRLSGKESRKINPAISRMEAIDEIPLNNLVGELNRKKMTPALYFVYSKKNCKKLMKESAASVGQLLTPNEQQEIERRIRNVKNKGIFLGTDFDAEIKPCLLKGFAMHHSGMLPQCKSFIEELGRSKLIKFCFATDTLGAGINFPFKTVVFSDFEKFGDSGFEEISVNSFKQGAGRAGRRGIDDIGYVISIPKEKDDAIIPYNKIVQDADDIQSAFKISYGLILSPRFLNNSTEVLKKSFDNFQNQSCDEKLSETSAMKAVLEQKAFIEEKGNKFRLTEKGKTASKIRGINEILMTELLYDNQLMQNISPSELAGIISIFAPEKDDNLSLPSDFSKDSYAQKVLKSMGIALNIRDVETQKGLESDININVSAMPYIKLWADAGTGVDGSLFWSTLVDEMISKNIVKTEGDFLKKINFTTNILKQLQKNAPSQYIKDISANAIKMLQKSPVNDILLYELDYKGTNE